MTVKLINIVKGLFLVGFTSLAAWQFTAPINSKVVYEFRAHRREFQIIREDRGALTLFRPRYYLSPDTTRINGELVRPVSMISDDGNQITVNRMTYSINGVEQND